MKRKHGLLLFITSYIPGCGQMQQGYMKRGICLMLAACILFTLPMFLYLEYLLVFLIPLWMFSFFDSYNLRNLADQDMAQEDAWLFGMSDMDSEKLTVLFQKRHSFVGWTLVILGVYILFDTVAGRLLQVLCEYFGSWWLYDMVMRDLPRMVVTIFIIALGVWFIRGPKQAKAEDIPAFTPPAAEAPPAEEPAEESTEKSAEPEVSHGEN